MPEGRLLHGCVSLCTTDARQFVIEEPSAGHVPLTLLKLSVRRLYGSLNDNLRSGSTESHVDLV